jgi:hypothetical protein
MRLPDGKPRLVTEYGVPMNLCWTAMGSPNKLPF